MKEKELKTTRIEIRVTPEEKELIKAYAEKRHLTISDVIRILCEEIFNPTDEVIEKAKLD